ncbi:CehA/McbA family metallohydrolase [Aquibium sp. A9E412]|uniref:PHP domain-containing protein n=1 Tax=Aquibium sp. A9E412 TaxID=2976767 RepID=UPI0025B0A5BA|nr:CehA/McbA family metallohydrolase [Aquibium sp. A9E412]MDN2564618.1 CehA/McbA family metallohydrolase [Aquibium sp. A9E412]
MLNAFTSPGSFLRGNLHCHSSRSDGDPTPERVCAFYRRAGYDFISLTDHFMERFGFPLVDTAAYRGDGFTTLIGAELHAPRLANGETWHLLANGLPLDFAPPGDGETAARLARRALDAGAFVTLAHPGWYGLTVEDATALPPVHAVEVFNAMCDWETGRGAGDYLLDQLADRGRPLGALATDDAHRYQGEACRGWVMVKAAENTPEAILAALKAGAYYASQGPQIHHADIEGDRLSVETSPVDSVWLVGQGARSAVVMGDGVTHARLPLDRFAGGWARLVIGERSGRRAWSNPFKV